MVLGGFSTTLKGLGVKLYEHMAQNSLSSRFQAYDPSYWTSETPTPTEEYDISVIRDIPVGMFMASGDEVCLKAQNDETKALLGDSVQAYQFYDVKSNGDFFVYAGKDMIDDMTRFLSGKPVANLLQ